MTWPQPHENVKGIDRTRDDLLSLDGPALRRRAVMMEMADKLWGLALQSPASPSGRSTYERMRDPRMGDLVMEVTSFRRLRDEETRTHGFGILLGKRKEWASTDEEWASLMADEPEDLRGNHNRPTDTAWYIQYGPKATDICRWTNCSFIAMPVGLLHHTSEQQP